MFSAVNFWARVAVGTKDECWPWLGALSDGYGRCAWNGKALLAYRIAAYLFGIIDHPATGRTRTTRGGGWALVIHKCDNRRCCNPHHLEVGSNSKNMKDSYDRQRRAAPQGTASSNSRFTAAQVRLIREKAAAGCSLRGLAAEFRVGQPTVTRIVYRQSYRNVL